MTITFEHNCRAQDAVKEACAGVSRTNLEIVGRWIRNHTGFESLADMVAASIAHGYTPTIMPVAKSGKAYREAELVANAYDAACTWAFGAGTGRRAYRPQAAAQFTRA